MKLIERTYLEISERTRLKVTQEINILKKIRNCNVVRLLEVFENELHIFIVTEL